MENDNSKLNEIRKLGPEWVAVVERFEKLESAMNVLLKRVEDMNGTQVTLLSGSGPDSFEMHEVAFTEGSKPIRMYDVSSSNLSAIGMDAIEGSDNWVLYVRFKGGTCYRYFPVTKPVLLDLWNEAKNAQKGDQEASVGSLFHYAVKVPADDGVIQCHKLNDTGRWVEVLPKSVRPKTTDKYKTKKEK